MTATTKIVLGVKDDGTMEAMLPPQKVIFNIFTYNVASGYINFTFLQKPWKIYFSTVSSTSIMNMVIFLIHALHIL